MMLQVFQLIPCNR